MCPALNPAIYSHQVQKINKTVVEEVQYFYYSGKPAWYRQIGGGKIMVER